MKLFLTIKGEEILNELKKANDENLLTQSFCKTNKIMIENPYENRSRNIKGN